MKGMVDEVERAATALRLSLKYFPIRGPNDFDAAFEALATSGSEALLELPSQMLFQQRRRLVDLGSKHRIPAMWNAREFVELGGLIAYGVSIDDLLRRAAIYVA